MNSIEDWLNEHPNALQLRPEFKTANGRVDVPKLTEAILEESFKLIREHTHKPDAPADLRDMSEEVIKSVQRGEIESSTFLITALQLPLVREHLLRVWEARTMLPVSKTKH